MRKFLCGRLREYGRACRLNLKDTGWGMKLVVLVITGFFCGALASEYFGTKLIFFAGGVFLGDMLLMVAVCLLSRFGDRIWPVRVEARSGQAWCRKVCLSFCSPAGLLP